MLRRGGRAAAVALLLGGVAGAAGTAAWMLAARWALRAGVEGPVAEGGWTRRSRAAFTASGFFPAERDEATGQYFSWTRPGAALTLHGLNRARVHRLEFTVRSGRPAGVPQAELRVFVDDRLRSAGPVAAEASLVAVEIGRAGRDGVEVRLDVSPPFEPGGHDPRRLGVIVDRVGVASAEGLVPAWAVGWAVLGALTSMALMLWLCGLRGALWVGGCTAVTAAVAWLLNQDAAFLDLYPRRLLPIALGGLGAGGLVALARARWPSVGGVADWSVAVGVLLAAGIVKIAVVAHPSMIVGDGLFQVHRAQVVAGGEYFFTSVTPKPFFEFPYPVALYVAAMPLWPWFPAELDALRLLRGVTLGAEWLAGLALFGAVRRLDGGRVAAWSVCLLWPLSQASVEALSNANLTNLFGQSLFAAAAGGLAWMAAAATVSGAGLALVTALLVAAFLSHFGTVTVGVVLLSAMAAALWWRGGSAGRRLATAVILAAMVAGAVSWAAYYSRFTDVYARTWASVAEREADDSSKLMASPAVKLERWWRGIGDDYGRPGVPALFAAAAGAVWLVRRRSNGGLVFLSWAIAWLVLVAWGLVTPITLRANLAAAPAIAVLGAVGVAALAGRGAAGGAAAIALVVAIAWDGWRVLAAAVSLP